MRRTFARILEAQMASNKDIHLLVADVGYGMFDRIRDGFQDRFWNVGAAEQAMVGMGVGLTLTGKVAICYSISPFLLWRPAELIRNYLDHERIPVILVGSGRDNDYDRDGFTHWCFDDHHLLNIWSNIEPHWPSAPDELHTLVPDILASRVPTYLNLKR
jgi:transketolase